VPAPLQRFVVSAASGAKGVEVVMRSHVVAYFGDASRPHAKWIALALVLASERAAGASYVDVRVPERAAAGFAPGTAPPAGAQESSSGSPSGATDGTATPESIAAAIAARLSAAVGSGEGPREQHHRGEEEAARGSSGSRPESGSASGGSATSEGGSSAESSSSEGGESGH
jgi:hypothetical protein